MQLKNWLQNNVAKWFLPDFSFKGGSALDCRALWIIHFKGVISAKMVKIIKFLFFAQKVSSGMGALRPKFLGG